MVIKQRRFAVVILFMIWSFVSLIVSWIPHWILFRFVSFVFNKGSSDNNDDTQNNSSKTLPNATIVLNKFIYENIYHYIPLINWRTLWYPFIIPAIYAIFLYVKSKHVFS